jgi:predicted nucleic-acid-binding protein
MSDSQDLARQLLEQESHLQTDQQVAVIMSEFLNAVHSFAADELLVMKVYLLLECKKYRKMMGVYLEMVAIINERLQELSGGKC